MSNNAKATGESDFLLKLEQRAEEQKRIVKTEILPRWAVGIGEWLVVNPWRMLAPLALLAYGIWRMAYGVNAREIILGIFGGFGK